MSTSRYQDQAMLDAAASLFNNTSRTRGDLLQAEAILLELLDDRSHDYGELSGEAGYIHSWLGLVYSEMDDRFDEGEAHYGKAMEIYSDDHNKVTIANNHASLLVKKGKLILEESEDLKEDARIKTPVSKAKKSAMRDLLHLASKGKGEITVKDAQTLRTLAETTEEAMECFRKAAELRELACKFQANVVSKATKEKERLIAAQPKALPAPKAAPIVYKSPAEILAILDGVAIGQHAAKRGLANAASQHIRRMQLSSEDRAKTDKSNVLLVGPTGCGKTLLAEALAGAINVPFYRTEATKLTAAGYVGEDVQSLLEGLLRACNYDVERAQNGIIYLDEIDKIAAAGEATSLDVGGESVQEELLTILEGTVVTLPKEGTKRSQNDTVDIDTTNILFILGGAFVRLGEIVARRLASTESSIGFGATVKAKETKFSHYQKDATAEDFVKFGMIPEFIGRIPKRLTIEALTVDQLERILVEPKKALVMQKHLLLSATTDLRFTKGALRAIAEEAHKSGTHGRALREIVELVLEPIVFEEPKVAIVTAEMVMNRNAEVSSQNQRDAAQKAATNCPFVCADDEVDTVREEAEAAAKIRTSPRRDRSTALTVIR